MGLMINIDNGGTFTDVLVSDGNRVAHAKSATTPHDLTQCFVEGLRSAAEAFFGEDDLARLFHEADYLRYSTTSGTNAVVEQKGVPVGLIVEKGHESDAYGAASEGGLWASMVPHAPRGLSLGKGGEVDSEELGQVVNDILSTGVHRLVVALGSETAEQTVKDILLDRYPRHLLGAIPFTISSDLSADPDLRRRTLTAVLNSYLHPGMEHFLYGAEQACRQYRMARPLLIFRNDGNSARVAKTTAVKTWGSGPRGGVEGAIAYADLYGEDALVGMDIGGTTSDLSVVSGHAVEHAAYGEVDDITISFPLPDLRSYGLGGSSVMRVEDGSIRIGPDSMGAAPGPACFGRGGTEATLTDALVATGVIDPDGYLGGAMKLDAARARQAIEARIADPLGLDLEAAAATAVEAFAKEEGAHIAEVLRSAGREAGSASLLAFGGGGPMLACGIAEAAGMKRVIVPSMAAVFSAFGIGFSDLAHSYEMAIDDPARFDADAAREDLLGRARRDMYGEGVEPEDCRYHFSLWAEKDGRATEKAIGGGAQIAASGAVKPQRIDGTAIKPEAGTTDPRLMLVASYGLPHFELMPDDRKGASPAPTAGTQHVSLGGSGNTVPVIADEALEAGHTAEGPALLRGRYLTCLVPAGWTMRVAPNKDLIFERGGA